MGRGVRDSSELSGYALALNKAAGRRWSAPGPAQEG